MPKEKRFASAQLRENASVKLDVEGGKNMRKKTVCTGTVKRKKSDFVGQQNEQGGEI